MLTELFQDVKQGVIELPAEITVGELLELLGIKKDQTWLMVIINRTLVNTDTKLKYGDRVVILPELSGG